MVERNGIKKTKAPHVCRIKIANMRGLAFPAFLLSIFIGGLDGGEWFHDVFQIIDSNDNRTNASATTFSRSPRFWSIRVPYSGKPLARANAFASETCQAKQFAILEHTEKR